MKGEKVREYDRLRIDKLCYKVITSKSADYNKASGISEETNEFFLTMDKNWVVFKMKARYSSVEEAKKVVEDYLERWKVIIGLEQDPGDLDFRYDTYAVEQICKDGKKGVRKSAHIACSIVLSDKVEAHISRNKFPNRPDRFKLSPDVHTMYERFKRYRQGKENLTSMAYMCLTVFQASARNASNFRKKNNLRGKASYQYNIDFDVLDKLGRLTAKGDALEARKVLPNIDLKPLTQGERDWIIRAVKVLIRRAGEWAYDPAGPHSLITMRQI